MALFRWPPSHTISWRLKDPLGNDISVARRILYAFPIIENSHDDYAFTNTAG